MNKKTENLVLYLVLAIVLIGLLFAVINVVKITNGSSYQKAFSAEDPSDICATPSGYTDADWKEHMGHHPDRYKECL